MSSRERILPPYTRRVDDLRHMMARTVGYGLTILLAIFFGFVTGVFGLYGWFIPAIPIALLALVVLWMAPDVDTRADGVLVPMFFLFLAVLLIWPQYIAMNLPGMPWISFQRLTMFPLAAVALYACATSARMRQEIADIARSNRRLVQLLLLWIALQTLMLAAAKFRALSMWTNMLFFRYFFFFFMAWLAVRPKRPQQLVSVVLVAAAITSAVVIPEFRDQRPLWAGHIPSFLSIDPAIIDSLNTAVLRSEEYRARSIFTNSLVYAEYLGMLMPFALLALSWVKKPTHFVLASLLLLLMITAGVLTQARTAMVALVATIPAFLGIWIVRRYRLTQKKRDLVAPALLSLYPLAAMALLTAVLTVNRVRVKVLGGSAQASSNDARHDQWQMALPQIVRNPFGYGMGTIEKYVPYKLLNGKFTIDSYPINLLIEYGVLGCLLFFAIFLVAIVFGIRTYVRAETRDELVAGAAAVGLISFLLSRLVLSMDGSTSLAFGYAGLILGLWYVQQRRAKKL